MLSFGRKYVLNGERHSTVFCVQTGIFMQYCWHTGTHFGVVLVGELCAEMQPANPWWFTCFGKANLPQHFDSSQLAGVWLSLG